MNIARTGYSFEGFEREIERILLFGGDTYPLQVVSWDELLLDLTRQHEAKATDLNEEVHLHMRELSVMGLF